MSEVKTEFLKQVFEILDRAYIYPTPTKNVVIIQKGLRAIFKKGFEERKKALIKFFFQKYDFAYIWLDDWNDNLLAQINCKWEMVSSHIYCIPRRFEIDLLYDELYIGRWQLLFSEHALSPGTSLEFLETSKDVEITLRRTGSKALIVSWYDDAEWMLGWL